MLFMRCKIVWRLDVTSGCDDTHKSRHHVAWCQKNTLFKPKRPVKFKVYIQVSYVDAAAAAAMYSSIRVIDSIIYN